LQCFFKVGPKSWFGSGLNLFSNIAMDDQMGYTAILTMSLIIGISLFQNKGENDSKGIGKKQLFKTSPLLISVRLR
jgi:hypothetical protein